jgi:hypothetical protein
MLYKQIIGVYCENRGEHINTLWQNVEFLLPTLVQVITTALETVNIAVFSLAGNNHYHSWVYRFPVLLVKLTELIPPLDLRLVLVFFPSQNGTILTFNYSNCLCEY